MSTIKEIAAEAGVSVMTVSNVINNNTARVSPETAERVRRIIEKHHYVPNMAARSLSSKASHIIALLLPLWNRSADSMLLDPYAGQMVGMLETLLREKGYYVMICSFETAEQALVIQRNWQIDGSVLILPHKDSITHELVKKSVSPLVVIDRRFDDLPMLSVCLNDRKGGYLSAKHLLEQGYRKIGFVSPGIHDSVVVHERYCGYLDALREYDAPLNPAWIFDGYFSQDGGEKAGRAIVQMEKRPDAMVATEDMLACGVMKACQAAGLRIPEDIAVVGFDDSMPSRMISPGLTTVRQDVRHKAASVVEILLEAIRNPELRDRHTLIDVELVERQSSHK